jgi:hypothetical protein
VQLRQVTNLELALCFLLKFNKNTMQEGLYSYLLPILKLLGILLAGFFGIAEHFKNKSKTIEQQRRNRFWSITAILISLTVATSAELVDTISKKHEAIDAAKRAEESAKQTLIIMGDLDRSLHPLFPIKIYPVFHAVLDSFPNSIRESAEYSLSTTDLQVIVFLIKNPTTVAINRENVNPDLSFALGKTYGKPFNEEDEDKPKKKSSFNNNITFTKGAIIMHIPYDTITASDCYSNGKIVSSVDLLGTQLIIKTSPFFELKGDVYNQTLMAEVSKAFLIDFINIELPGSQEIQLHQKDFKIIKSKEGNLFIYTFPKTKEDMLKIFLP